MRLKKMSLNRIDVEGCFEYVSSNHDDNKWTGIKLLPITGDYQDIIYKYGKVEFGEEENENGDLPLTFHYDVLYSGNHTEKELQEDNNFKNLIGDVLMVILERQLKEDNLQYVNTDD